MAFTRVVHRCSIKSCSVKNLQTHRKPSMSKSLFNNISALQLQTLLEYFSNVFCHNIFRKIANSGTMVVKICNNNYKICKNNFKKSLPKTPLNHTCLPVRSQSSWSFEYQWAPASGKLYNGISLRRIKKYLMILSQGSHGLYPAHNDIFRVNNNKTRLVANI